MVIVNFLPHSDPSHLNQYILSTGTDRCINAFSFSEGFTRPAELTMLDLCVLFIEHYFSIGY